MLCAATTLVSLAAFTPAPAAALECSDGSDNDGDGRVDFPADQGCSSPDDPSEVSDQDGDGISDLLDLCVLASNAGQQDTDGDGYGNACDADYDQSLTTTVVDFGYFLATFGGPGTLTDHDGSGTVTVADFGIFLAQFLKSPSVPGPSGLFQRPPVVTGFQLDATVFPVPGPGERIPVGFAFSFDDPDADLHQLIVSLEGPTGPVFRLLDGFTPSEIPGSVHRSIPLEEGYAAGGYTLRLQLVDAAENESTVASAAFSLDPGIPPPIRISAIVPSSPGPGDTVQLFGSGFAGVDPSLLRVSFPGAETAAEIVSIESGVLEVVVPRGALAGPVVIESPLGMYPSAESVDVTPTVSITPEAHALLPGERVPLECRVSGIENALVSWTASAGTIDGLGVYTAPATLPSENPVAVRCAWQGDPLLHAEALVEILPPTPLPGEATVLAAEGAAVFTAAREVELSIAPLALSSDTQLELAVPPASALPADGLADQSTASVALVPAGVPFSTPAEASFELRYWKQPGSTMTLYRAVGSPSPVLVPAGTATVDATGARATAAVAETGTYLLKEDLAVTKDFAASVFEGVLGQGRAFQITRPLETEWLEGLRIPIVIQPTTTPPNEVGPFFDGVEIVAALDGHGPIDVGPRVQPDATAWQVGTYLWIPVLPGCARGQYRDGTITVRYPAATGSTAQETLDFTIACLDELEFAAGQPPVPMPVAGIWDTPNGRGRLRLIPGAEHRYSRIVIGSGGELAAYHGNPFNGPLRLEVTNDVRIETGGRISTETFEPPADPRIWGLGDGEGSYVGDPGAGGPGTVWYGANGGVGGGDAHEDGRPGASSSHGGVGGAGGLSWEYANWLSVVTSGASTVYSFATFDWGGAAEGVYDVVGQSVLVSNVAANRMRGTGRGGRAAPRAQISLADVPQGGGGGGGSGKMIQKCGVLGIDLCPDEGGQGGGGGGGGAHPLEMLVGGAVFVAPGASIQGRGAPGGFGGMNLEGAPGGGGAGGNGAYVRIAAGWLFNEGLLTAAGGVPGLSVGCVCPASGCVQTGRMCGGDKYIIAIGNGERGRDGVFRVEAGWSGALPQNAQFSLTGTTSDPWDQNYAFPFPGLGDSDGDGLKDGLEDWIGTRSDRADTDLDGLGDYAELSQYGTDPVLADTDGDGLLDGFEVAANPWVTNPLLADTDGDGFDDGFEVAKGSDPTNGNSGPEICDGIDNDLDSSIDEDCEVRLDHQGREFFIPFLLNEGIGTTSLSLTVTSDGYADVTVEYPVGTVLGTWSVTPDQAREISIPAAAANGWPLWSYPTAPPTPALSTAVASNAVRVTATFDVAVMATNNEPGTRDIALALPNELLGQEYYVQAQPPPGTPAFGAGAHFIVVATQNDTTVTVEGIGTGLAPVVLDRGEGVAIQSWYGVEGDHVIANKKVVVANGNRCARVPANGGKYCSHLYEIALPVERWGNAYLAATTNSSVGGRDVLSQRLYSIVAAQDDTSVWVNGSFYGVLDAGTSPGSGVAWIAPTASDVRDFAHIEADKPIFGAQFMYSLCSEFPSDPGCTNVANSTAVGSASMANLIPTGRWPRRTSFKGASVFTIVAPTADAASGGVLIDGVPVQASAFEPFPSAPEWSVFTANPNFWTHLYDLESPAGHAAWMMYTGLGVGSSAPVGYDYDTPFTSPACSGALAYDGGTPTWHHAVSQGLAIAVKFTPTSYPWTFDRARFWPWSSSTGLDFEVHVWDDDGPSGAPGTDLVTPFVHSATNTDQWEDVDLPPVTITSGEFYIGWVQSSASSYYYNGRDGDATQAGRSYVRNSAGNWVTLASLGDVNDMMIRQSCR